VGAVQPNVSAGAEHARYDTVLPLACLYTELTPKILNSDGRLHTPIMLQVLAVPRSIHPQCLASNTGVNISGSAEHAHGSASSAVTEVAIITSKHSADVNAPGH
jgi:hypothetical protein